MDSRCRAWKLRNSSEIWRPHKHTLNSGNAPVDREKRSTSDDHGNFSATTPDSEKSLQAKWNSRISFSRDTSNVGSKTSSPIMRYRTLSPDLCRACSIDNMKISQSVHQAQDKNNVTRMENDDLSKYIRCVNLEQESSTDIVDTINKEDNIPAFEVWMGNHQRLRHNTSSSHISSASQKGVIGRSKSVSPHMWQEKKFKNIEMEKNIMTKKRCQSSQGVIKKQKNEAKNNYVSQILDIVMVPPIPLPTTTQLQRSMAGLKEPSSSVDQALHPLSQDLEDIRDELILCSSQILADKIFDNKETSKNVSDRSHMNNQNDDSFPSMKGIDALKSQEQCITMRVNMAFEPITRVKSFTSHGSKHTEENKMRACSLTSLQGPLKKKLTSSEVVKQTTHPKKYKEDELWFQNYSQDLETHVMYSSNRAKTLKEKNNKYEIRSTKNKCEVRTTCLAFEEYLSLPYDTTKESFEVIEDQFLLPVRRWPKISHSILDKNYPESLPTSLAASNNDYLLEESAQKSEIKLLKEDAPKLNIQVLEEDAPTPKIKPKEEFMSVKNIGCKKNAIKNTQNEDFLSDSIIQKTKKIQDGLSSRDLSSTHINSTNDALRMRDKFIEKVVVRSSSKWTEEILPTFLSKTNSELKAGVFSSKSKRSLERATLAIKEKKRKDENSQCATEFQKNDICNKILTITEVPLIKTLNVKEKELECNDESDYSLQKSLKMKKMTISGPAEAFREIKINNIVGSIHLASLEPTFCASNKSCTSLETTISRSQASIQQMDLTCDFKVLEPSKQAISSIDLDDLVTVDNLIEHSNHNTSSVMKLDEDGVTSNPSSPKIYKNIEPCYPSKVIVQDETKLCLDNISNTWNDPLQIENKSSDRGSLSSEKFSSILSYLGHVEESNLQDNCKFLKKKDFVQEDIFFNLKGNQSPCTVLEHEDSVSLTNSTLSTSLTNISSTQSKEEAEGMSTAISLFEGVRKKMQEFRSKIATKESQNVKLLQDIERLKTDKVQALSLERDRFEQELKVRAIEYKAAIQHHLDLNEKMVKDKEVLSNKCCNLVGTLNTIEHKYEEKMKALKEQCVQELKKQKEIWIAGEKPRREAWKEKKIKEIKELTIKGLEPHIDSLNEKQKQEIKRLEMRFADEMQKKLEVHSIQHRQEICELRSRILKERDEIVEKERFATLTRLNDVAEKYEQQAMELRRKVTNDMTMELEKVEEARRRDKQMAHDMLSKAREEWNDKETTLKDSLENCIQHAIVEKEAEILSLQSELERFKIDWQKDFDEKLIKNLHVQEDEFRSRCTKERDEQIEMIIEKMEKEKEEAIVQHQQEYLVKVETLMEEKLELMKKLKEVESKCAKLCNISLKAKQKAEMEIAIQDLQMDSLRKEILNYVDINKQLKTKIQQEKKNLQEQQQRYELQLVKEHELVQTKQLEVERCNEETQQLRLRKVQELEEVEMHVKKAIEKKDHIIAGLREQLMAAREQIRHTQLLLQQEHVAFLADPD